MLATNMISVGVDVDRLGLMAVMGQPQSSAEYIQATSRVGRQHAGLVVNILNAARSRDRSHYETFVPFHRSVYRAVEATSATPFAARARDRGLHGVLVSLARLLFSALSSDSGAAHAPSHRRELDQLGAHRPAGSCSLRRGGRHRARRGRLGSDVDRCSRGAPGPAVPATTAIGGRRCIEPADALTEEEIDHGHMDVPWPTLQSLRDVDAESTLYEIPLKKVH